MTMMTKTAREDAIASGGGASRLLKRFWQWEGSGVLIALIVLIIARSLRDEYAERIWQKSAASFVNLLPLFPILWLGGIFIFADQGGWLNWLRANPNATILPDYMNLSNPTRSVGIHQFEGLSFVVLKLTQYFPLVFVAIYKWHRWRDER